MRSQPHLLTACLFVVCAGVVAAATADPHAIQAQAFVTPTVTPIAASEQAIIDRLMQTPVLYNLTTDAVYAIAARGRDLGNRPDVFTTVGDSNTTNGDFMRPIGVENAACDLGAYADLQTTIDWFMVSPRAEQANSFVNDSVAADRGFGTSIVLDPLWAEWRLCDPNESPLVCEYRIAQPSVAVIMLGQIDINYGEVPPDQYAANMRIIVDESIARGVIPVINTIVFARHRDVWDEAMHYNAALLDIAEAYQIPLINVWRAVQGLPDDGLGADQSHLKAVPNHYCDFNGGETQYGGTLRNLLTLQALDILRREVLAP